jgi:hypothetical protein
MMFQVTFGDPSIHTETVPHLVELCELPCQRRSTPGQVPDTCSQLSARAGKCLADRCHQRRASHVRRVSHGGRRLSSHGTLTLLKLRKSPSTEIRCKPSPPISESLAGLVSHPLPADKSRAVANADPSVLCFQSGSFCNFALLYF